MSRITMKQDNGFYTLKDREKLFNFENEVKLVQILGLYEDLEEEIGCPLNILVEALAKGIYCRSLPTLDKLNFYNNLRLSKSGNKWFLTFGNLMCVSVEEYKTLWFLKEDWSE